MNSYGLSKKIIVYIKDEGVDLNSMTPTFKSVVNCEVLGLEESLMALVLVMHFPKPISMLLLNRGYAKILSLSQ